MQNAKALLGHHLDLVVLLMVGLRHQATQRVVCLCLLPFHQMKLLRHSKPQMMRQLRGHQLMLITKQIVTSLSALRAASC